MYPTISLGSLVLPTTGIVYIFGAWLSLSSVERAAKALKLDAEVIYNLAATALAAGFIGARLAFVILHWDAFRENLSGIVWPLTGGFNPWAGLIIGLLAALFYGRSKNVPALRTIDSLAPGLLVGLIAVSMADFFGGPGYGVESKVPWAIDVFGIRRHPVQVYELLFGLGGLTLWWIGQKQARKPGQLFFAVAALYSGGRLFVDAFRANTPLTENGFHLVQIFSLATLLVSVYVLGRIVTREGEHSLVQDGTQS